VEGSFAYYPKHHWLPDFVIAEGKLPEEELSIE
jgi:hypothetical protein